MPINTNTGFISQGKTAGLINATPADIRQVLTNCLVTNWEQHIIDSGEIPGPDNRLIARYEIQREYDIPAIWVGNAPDENQPDNQGCELVIYGDPKAKRSNLNYKQRLWTISVTDRTESQTRIYWLIRVLEGLFESNMEYKPHHDSVEDDLRYANGIIKIDLIDHFKNLNNGFPGRSQ